MQLEPVAVRGVNLTRRKAEAHLNATKLSGVEAPAAPTTISPTTDDRRALGNECVDLIIVQLVARQVFRRITDPYFQHNHRHINPCIFRRPLAGIEELTIHSSTSATLECLGSVNQKGRC